MNTTHTTLAARTALRVLAVMALVFGLLLALPGCGGGSDDEDTTDTRPTTPLCQQRPEVCQ